MEVSGKILREVEFRDRLRGYDTDEVDEFLEKVAVAVDELRAQLASANERAREVERRVEEFPVPDDDSIRRTLVLAQRTADLAINEAREEATRLVEEASAQAQTTIAQAQESAHRLRNEAEQDLHDRVMRLSDHREHLEREVQTLARLLESERERLSQALHSALRFVDETLSLSDEAATVTASRSGPAPQQPSDGGTRLEDRAPELDLGDIEDQISEDAALALGSERTSVEEPSAPPTHERHHGSTEDVLDPDEELWARWAKGAGIGESEEGTAGDHVENSFGLDRPGGAWSD